MAKNKNKQKKTGKSSAEDLQMAALLKKAGAPASTVQRVAQLAAQFDAEDDEDEDETDEEAGIVEDEEERQARLEAENVEDIGDWKGPTSPEGVDLVKLEKDTRPARHPAHDTELSPSDILLASLAMVASGMMTEDAVAEQVREAFASMKPRQRVAQGSALIAFLNKIRQSALQLSAIVERESKRE